MAMFGFPHWQLKSTSTESGVVAPDERLPFAQTAIMGVQHAVAMFGATVLMPILMGLDPNAIGPLIGLFHADLGRADEHLAQTCEGVTQIGTGFLPFLLDVIFIHCERLLSDL